MQAKNIEVIHMSRQILSKDRIIQAAVAIIEAGGTPTFSTISRRLGSRSQALYPYFANQTELSFAIFDWVARQLNDQIKTELFGLSGREGLIALAVAMRREGLAHVRLTQYLLSIPRDTANADMQQGTDLFRDLLGGMIRPVFQHSRVRLIAARWLRDLIVGDVVNIGAGWFIDQGISADDSFELALTASLDRLTLEDQQDTQDD
ncbi:MULTISPECIES: TetR/AcrR family transcriptional regulator [Lactobacillaceae]|nr:MULTISPECIES: TetR/AcrR family transcriptional regulator [Lactobacillaceae]